jgi:hypothetical protein
MNPNLFRERKGMGIRLNNKELIARLEKKLPKFAVAH